MLDQQDIDYRDFPPEMGALQPDRRWNQADRLKEEKAAGSACQKERVQAPDHN